VAVSEDYETHSPDWPLIRHELDAVGVIPSLQRWSDARVPWDTFDLILAHGAWDNIHHPDEFVAWADRVGDVTRIVNAPAILRWNINKRYLAVLSDAGVPTVPTTWIDPPASAAAPSEFPLPSAEFVVKPSISGGGFETARYAEDEILVARAHIGRLLSAGRSAMIQPYQATVDTLGETSLIFLGGQFSHAIAKAPLLRPGAGPQANLAIHEQITATTASDVQQVTAEAALAAAESLLGTTTYARIDLLTGPDGSPAVLELELLDPALFLDTQPRSAVARFARILRQLMP
jgi:glutathione synthase/RimK-type ligase-like ATP-grasp enzyme